jgi:protein-disulfide isomerase
VSRRDRLELAAVFVGLGASLILLVPAVLEPSRALRPLFGAGSLARVPVVALAALWFLVVLAVRSRTTPADRQVHETVSTYMLFPATLWLGIAIHQLRSLSSWRALHPATAVVYLAVAAIAVLSALREILPLRDLPRQAWRDLRTARARTWAAFGVVLAAVAAAVLLIPRPRTERSPWPPLAEFDQWYSRQERQELPAGKGQAAVTVVKFHDYQCPPCRKSFEDHKPLADDSRRAHEPGIAYVTRDFPLDAECNPNVRTSLHPLACEAAVAVRLAGRHQRDDAMAAWLFGHQGELSKEAIAAAAREVGGVEDFEGAYALALEEVKADVALGHRLGVQGTPTVFVNGVKLGSAPRSYLEAAIAYELRQRGAF